MSREPKYEAVVYNGLTMPNGDTEGFVEGLTAKLVKCRKEHQCSYCGATIRKGDFAVYEKGFMDGRPVGVHDCLDCAEDYIDGWDDDAQDRWERRAEENNFL